MMRKKAHAGGGHGGAWVVTFADLVSLLMAFFVMLLSFSVQDQEKLNVASGSVRDAFGIVTMQDKAGVIERGGNPQREFARDVTDGPLVPGSEFATLSQPENDNQGPEANTYLRERTQAERAAMFSLAAASLKQAWQDLPDITGLADHLILSETSEGLDILIADQQGRPMFAEGSKHPNEAAHAAIVAMAPLLAQLPNQIRISGHVAAGGRFDNPGYGPWELSFDRANATRQLLEEHGLSPSRIHSVVGRGQAEPLFPDDPYLAANQRVSILIMFDEPPVPAAMSF